MYCIIGEINEVYQERYGDPYTDHYTEEVIATFDSEKEAEDYIKKSALKQVIRNTYAANQVYKKNCLLSGCVEARVEKYYKPFPPPHNPEV